MEPETRLFIDGELCNAASGKRYPNINPATEEVMGEVADAGREDMDQGYRRGAPSLRRDRLVHQSCVPPALS